MSTDFPPRTTPAFNTLHGESQAVPVTWKRASLFLNRKPLEHLRGLKKD